MVHDNLDLNTSAIRPPSVELGQQLSETFLGEDYLAARYHTKIGDY